MYFIVINNQQAGPYSIDQMKELIKDGTLTKQTYIWKEGMENWEFAGQVEEVNNLFITTSLSIPVMPTVAPSVKSSDDEDSTFDDSSDGSEIARTRFFEFSNGKLRFLEGFSGPDNDLESYDCDTNLIEERQELVDEEIEDEKQHEEVRKLMPEIKEVYFGNVFKGIDVNTFQYFDFSNVVKLDFSEAKDLNYIWGFFDLKKLRFVALPDNVGRCPGFYNCPKMKEIHMRTLGNMNEITGDKDGNLSVYVEDEDSELIAPEYRITNYDEPAINFLEDEGDIYLPERLIGKFVKIVNSHRTKNNIRIHSLPEGYNHWDRYE